MSKIQHIKTDDVKLSNNLMRSQIAQYASRTNAKLGIKLSVVLSLKLKLKVSNVLRSYSNFVCPFSGGRWVTSLASVL